MNPFTIILALLDLGAAVWALCHGRSWEAVYWFSAATLTVSILGMGK